MIADNVWRTNVWLVALVHVIQLEQSSSHYDSLSRTYFSTGSISDALEPLVAYCPSLIELLQRESELLLNASSLRKIAVVCCVAIPLVEWTTALCAQSMAFMATSRHLGTYRQRYQANICGLVHASAAKRGSGRVHES